MRESGESSETSEIATSETSGSREISNKDKTRESTVTSETGESREISFQTSETS